MTNRIYRPLILATTFGLLVSTSVMAPADNLKTELKGYPHKILYEAYHDGNWDLFIMNADGSDQKPLTHTPDLHEHYPQATPDGKKICFLGDKGEGRSTIRGIYTMNVDGTDRKCIAQKGRHPCWSPDGDKIAYVQHEFDRFQLMDYVDKGLYIYDCETGGTTAIDNSENIEHIYVLNWSTDGNWIIATCHAGMGFKHTTVGIEIEGNRILDLGTGGCRPSVGADGQCIAWSITDHLINIAKLDFSDGRPKITNIEPLVGKEPKHFYHPDVSPDGKYVAYSVSPGGGRVKADGPGTHTGIGELIGVKGHWSIRVVRISDKGKPQDIEQFQLTDDPTMSPKEAEWIRDE